MKDGEIALNRRVSLPLLGPPGTAEEGIEVDIGARLTVPYLRYV